MKKIKISLIVTLAIFGAAICSFFTKPLTAQWYGQKSDPVGGIYSTADPISAADLNTKCPTAPVHICAAALNPDGMLDGSQNPNTRMSTDYFK